MIFTFKHVSRYPYVSFLLDLDVTFILYEKIPLWCTVCLRTPLLYTSFSSALKSNYLDINTSSRSRFPWIRYFPLVVHFLCRYTLLSLKPLLTFKSPKDLVFQPLPSQVTQTCPSIHDLVQLRINGIIPLKKQKTKRISISY